MTRHPGDQSKSSDPSPSQTGADTLAADSESDKARLSKTPRFSTATTCRCIFVAYKNEKLLALNIIEPIIKVGTSPPGN